MMSNKCCVPSYCASDKIKFGIPKNYHDIWEKAIGILFNMYSKVCEEHFKSSNIVSTYVSRERSNQISVCFNRIEKVCS